MHRTLKQAATQPPEKNFRAQQQCFDHFLKNYKQNRPHESLDQKTPASCYQSSRRLYNEKPESLTYPEYFVVRRVQGCGVVSLRRHRVYITHLLDGYDIGLNEIAQGIWEAFLGSVRLGRFDERDAQQKSVSYLSLKTVTPVP